ncbi:xanthine dehydrogenase family protein molybdopterin-binding subunit [Amycolatopsis endophytica]|uniref:Carbon-monoxide dehydrogenase large subunit n=1 Tax=Amycolatopsis endophytica TaxID=860233 RepID=A0A853B1G9_9PSEU|nr:xanthine dehydrogenase family protein molybdopterin-binding subunit [Amycolatopsis endophytica]NYI88840.1 carbon-monoxide dehydrogenase large subunit [Amycolatopsis endophytica]
MSAPVSPLRPDDRAEHIPRRRLSRVDGPLRRDGDAVASGQAHYLDDVVLPGMLHAAILRSPHPHARIRSVDTSAAERCAGVRVAVSGEDLRGQSDPVPHYFDPGLFGFNTADFFALAVDKVRWVGEPVAAVVADSLANAEAALAAIVVDYDVLPSVIEAEDALADDAVRVFDHWDRNLLGVLPFAHGDAAGRLAGAPHRVRERITIGRHQGVPLEPRGYIGSWERRGRGRLELWASTQSPHLVRTGLARILHLPEERIRVIAPRMGGGFGHKFNGYSEELLVCLLSRLVGAPVKWVETRADSLLVGAREFAHDIEAGFDDDGLLVAFTVRMIANIGCLASWGGWGMAFMAGLTFPGPYVCENYSIETLPVITNKAPWNGYRGYGKEQAAVVLERVMDVIAARLDLDPAEVRRRNMRPADSFPLWAAGKHLDSGDHRGALDKVVRLSRYHELRRQRDEDTGAARLRGVGIGFELTPEGGELLGTSVRGHDTSTVRVHPGGTVTVLTGVTSPGTGNETSIAYLVARELGIGLDQVEVVQGDTDRCPFGYGNFSSRSLNSGGAAAVLAAREIRGRLVAVAAGEFGCDASDVAARDGRLVNVRDEDQSVPFAELVLRVYQTGSSDPGVGQALLEATRVEGPHNYHHDPGESGLTNAYPMYSSTSAVAVVEVDPETGVVTLADLFAVGDCGTIVNHNFVNSQLYGALAQGVGGALWEHSPYDDGTGEPLARTFKHYLLPRAPDLPAMVVDHQETPSPFTLMGTKGAGESGVGAAMAAVVNAVNDALRPVGASVTDLPLDPPRVLRAIGEARTRQSAERRDA